MGLRIGLVALLGLVAGRVSAIRLFWCRAQCEDNPDSPLAKGSNTDKDESRSNIHVKIIDVVEILLAVLSEPTQGDLCPGVSEVR